jgi:UDP-glucose 4-epimerase
MLFLPATVCVKGYDPPVQFVHEDDFVAACILAMDKKIPGAFNITGNGTLTVSKIADMLGTKVVTVPAWLLYPALECLWRLHFPKIEVNRGYLDYIRYPFVASNKKAKKMLGFNPKYTSTQTLKSALRG